VRYKVTSSRVHQRYCSDKCSSWISATAVFIHYIQYQRHGWQ